MQNISNSPKGPKNSWAFITGASAGIGKEFAIQLAQRGLNLFLVARRKERLLTLKEQLEKQYGIKVFPLPYDLMDPVQIMSSFKEATSKGKVVYVINNAGLGTYQTFHHSTWEDQKKMIDLNTTTPTFFTHLFIPHMLGHGLPSRIVQVASLASYVWAPKFSVYNGTKSYLRAFSETLNHELKSTNINLTCLCPGGVRTEFSDVAGQSLTPVAEKAMMTPEPVVKGTLKACEKGKSIYIPGYENKLGALLASIFPTKLVISIISLLMGKMISSKKPMLEGQD